MSITAHYLFSVVVLAVYGGQVCPYIDSLDIVSWAVMMAAVFAGMAVARRRLAASDRMNVAPQKRANAYFVMDLALFAAGGLLVTLFNMAAFTFPFTSGLKILLGFLGLGFFAGADSAMMEERRIAGEIMRSGSGIVPSGKFLPLTGKFAVTASVTVLLAVSVIFLLINRDFAWLTQQGAGQQPQAVVAIIIELMFVSAVLLIEILNIINSFSKNLKMFFANENGALELVAGGNLESAVPVSTDDEFGVMGYRTNLMIGKLRERTRELLLTRDVTILSMTSLAEIRDNETGKHILRTQRYVRALADHLRKKESHREYLSEEMVDLLFKSAPLHDIGKVGVPDHILLKPGKHTPEEFELMKKHTVFGKSALKEAEKILGETSFLKVASEIACSHHEKWDGTGYPEGLAGERIPLSARLMAVADVYDALISKRVYKPAFTHEKAKELILAGNGSQFDPDTVAAFLAVEEEFKRIKEKYGDREEVPEKTG